MSDTIHDVAKALRRCREICDPVSEAGKEVLPYTRRVKDALGALRAIVTDDTPDNQLESDLRVVHGIVAALVGGEKAMHVIEKLPEIRCAVSTDVSAAYEKDPSATSYGEIIAAFPSILAVSTHRIAHVFYQLDDPVGAMADLHRAIAIEPRHFNAWTGLGHILMASDDKARALQAYRRVLTINPQMSDVKTIVNRLGPDVDGQDL